MSVGRTVTRNTKWNAAGRLWEAAVSLVLIRYVADRIDPSALGLWFILGTVTGYAALFDLGIGSSFAKYVAEYAARDERSKVSSVVTVGLAFYLVLGIVLVAVGWPCAELAVSMAQNRGVLAGVSPDDVRFLLRWCLVLYAAAGCVSAFSSVIAGMQRMELSTQLSFLASLVKVGVTVALLETGFGVRGLLAASAASTAVFGVGCVVAAFRLVPGLRVSPRHLDAKVFRRMFGYGWRTQVARLANLVMIETDRVIVGAFAGLGLVPAYEFGLMIANKLRQVPAMLLAALVPAASDLDAREDHERLRRLYLLASKYVAAITIPLVAFAIGTADLIMRTWMGDMPGLDTSAWVLRIIAVAYVANLMPGAGVAVVLGKGRADMQMIAGLICTVSNVVLTVVLWFAFGFWGIPIATAIAMYLGWAWFAIAVRRVVDVGLREFLRVTLAWPVVASAPGLAACAVCDHFSGGATGFVVNAALLLACGVGFASTYLLLIRQTPFLDAFDVGFLEESLYLSRVPGFQWWARRMRRV